jgi:hypothetical protein
MGAFPGPPPLFARRTRLLIAGRPSGRASQVMAGQIVGEVRVD